MASEQSGGASGDRETGPEGDLVAKAERKLAELLEQRLPNKPVERSELAQTLAQVLSVELREIFIAFSGPLPPPGMLKQYEESLPGLAERIVARAEKEQTFRHDITRERIAGVKAQQRHVAIKTYVGQCGAFVIAMTAIGGGIWLLATGKSTEGLWSIIGALASLVAVFIGGKIADAIRSKSGPSSPSAGPNGVGD